MDKQKDMFRAATDDFWDMILLNILYVFSCLLLVTYGAATAALYFTVAHLDRKREYGGAAAMYWETFKMNLRKCLVPCIAVFALLALLTLNFSIAAQFQGMLRYCSYGLQGFLLLLVQVLITVGFPLLAENGSAAVDAGKRAFGVLAEIPGRVFLACLLQQFAVAGDVAAFCQLGERDVGGDDADEQREKARGQRHEAECIGDGACRQPGDKRQA